MARYTACSLIALLGISAAAQRVPDTLIEGDGAVFAAGPQLAAFGDTLYCVWDADPRLGELRFSRSLDRGQTWSTPIRIDQPFSCGIGSFQLAASGSSIYVMWEACPSFGGEVRFNRSLDGGLTWLSSNVVVGHAIQPERSIDRPRMAVDGASIYVVWENGSNEIRFNRSLDSGSTWLASPTKLDTDSGSPTRSQFPSIAVSGSSVYVAWSDSISGSPRVHFNRSLDNGSTWLPTSRLIQVTAAPHTFLLGWPRIAADGSDVHVVWRDTRALPASGGITISDGDVYLQSSTDSGSTWRPAAVRVGPGPNPGALSCAHARVAVNGPTVHVWWLDPRQWPTVPFERFDLYFNRSLDGGSTWLPTDRRISDGAATITYGNEDSIVTGSGSSLYAAWADGTSGANGDVFFSSSRDGGLTWQSPSVRLDTGTTSGNRTQPHVSLALSGDSVFAAWRDPGTSSPGIRFNIPFGFIPYGVSGVGTGGFAPQIAGFGAPQLGNSTSIDCTDVLGSAAAAVLIGAGPTSRIDIPLLGETLLVNPFLALPIAIGGAGAGAGSGALPITVSSDPALVGENYNFQCAVIDPAGAAGIVLTNAVEMWIGS